MSTGGDSSSETTETIGPDGSVTYNFAGHIAATGVDITADANDLTSLPLGQKPVEAANANAVRWLRASDGAMVAQVAGARATRTGVELSEASLLAVDPAAAGGVAEAQLLAARNPNAQSQLQEFAGIQARVSDDAGMNTSGVFARARLIVGGGATESDHLIIDWKGRSDFAFRQAFATADSAGANLAAGAIDPASATTIVAVAGWNCTDELEYRFEFRTPASYTGSVGNSLTLGLFIDNVFIDYIAQEYSSASILQIVVNNCVYASPGQGIHAVAVKGWQGVNGGGAAVFTAAHLRISR